MRDMRDRRGDDRRPTGSNRSPYGRRSGPPEAPTDPSQVSGHGVEPEHTLLGPPVAVAVQGEDRPVTAHVRDDIAPSVVEPARQEHHGRRGDVESVRIEFPTVRVGRR